MHMVFWVMRESKETMTVHDRALSSMLSKTLVAPDTDKTQDTNNTTKVETPSTLRAAHSIVTNMETSITDNKATDRHIMTPGSRGRTTKETEQPQTSKNSSRGAVKSMSRC